MNILKAVDNLLITGGIPTDKIKLSRQPDQPVECITVLDTGGMQPDSEITAVHEPTFQLLIRAADYDTAKDLADQARVALHGKIAVQAEGVHFFFIELLNEPGSIGQNERGEEEISANFRCKVRAAFAPQRRDF